MKTQRQSHAPLAPHVSLCGMSLVAALMIGAASPPATPTVLYRQPAEHVSIGNVPHVAGEKVLASGRLIDPTGEKTTVAGRIEALAFDPQGRFVILAVHELNGTVLHVLDRTHLRQRSQLTVRSSRFGGGLRVALDPVSQQRQLVLMSTGLDAGVRFFALDDKGVLLADAVAATQLPADSGPHDAGQLEVSQRDQQAYMVDELGAQLLAVSLRSRHIRPIGALGFAPHALGIVGDSVIVANEGLLPAARLDAVSPQYGALSFDLDRASSAMIFHPFKSTSTAKSPVKLPRPQLIPVPMDPTPRGLLVGGAHPTAIVGGNRTAYVALAGVDRIAVVDTTTAKVIGGTELRLFDRGPYGTQPIALALDAKAHRLYVALAGANAVAILDVQRTAFPHRLGLIPTGQNPRFVHLSPDGSQLYIASELGVGANPEGLLQKVSLDPATLAADTQTVLRDLRRVTTSPLAPQPKGRVVQIRMPAATYDEVFGSAAQFSNLVMPVLHHLAHRYQLATNFYSNAKGPLAAEQLALAGEITPFTLRTESIGGARRWEGSVLALGPDDAPRYGYFFDSLSRAKIPFRNYGALGAMQRYSSVSDPLYAAALASGRADACALAFSRDHLTTKKARFIEITLPDRLSGDPIKAATEADAALGQIVDTLAKDADWDHTTVFISPWRASGGVDHVDPRRTYAVVIAPNAKRAKLLDGHRALEGMLKAEELILNLPPLSLGDLLSSPIEALPAGESRPNG